MITRSHQPDDCAMSQHQEAVDWKRILAEVPYPIEAFAFVREGLSYAVQRVHEDPEALEEEDRQYLLNKAYSDWVNTLWLEAADGVDDSNLTQEVIQWAIERVSNS